MDIIIEGKITADETMSEVVQTVIDLKNLTNPILRISSTGNEVQGRIAFSKGHLLGGRVNNSDESGYPAIRKLLSVTEGNYAILDPGRNHVADVNQSLWLEASKIVQSLPYLPNTPESLLDADPESLKDERPKFAAMDLRVGDEDRLTKTDVKNKSRAHNPTMWRMFKTGFWTVVGLIIAILIVQIGIIRH